MDDNAVDEGKEVYQTTIIAWDKVDLFATQMIVRSLEPLNGSARVMWLKC